MKDEIATATVKAAPPSLVVCWSYLADMPLDKWLTAVTIIYVLLQMFFLLKDRLQKHRNKNES